MKNMNVTEEPIEDRPEPDEGASGPHYDDRQADEPDNAEIGWTTDMDGGW